MEAQGNTYLLIRVQESKTIAELKRNCIIIDVKDTTRENSTKMKLE